MATDNFNRADGGLGANWDSFAEGGPGATVPTINSNEAIGHAGVSGESFATWNADPFANDQFSEFGIGGISLQTGSWLGAIVRAADQDHYYLIIYFLTGGVYSLILFKKTASGAYTSIGSTTLPGNLSIGDVVRLEAEGTTISVLVNSVQKISVTDATYSTGDAGISIFTQGTTGSIDNWSGGDLHPAATFVPQIVAYG